MTDVLHLSARDNEGGAARATYRLHRGLRTLGVDSKMLVQKKVTDDPNIDGLGGHFGTVYDIARRKIDAMPVSWYCGRDSELFSPAWLPEKRDVDVTTYDPDIIHLHWVAGGFLRPDTISNFNQPIVWTLHDMWPLTGGCHYAKSCTKYEDKCGACPHLGSDSEKDLSRSTWLRKRSAWEDQSFTVVAPSRWLASCAEASSLLSEATVEVIPNGLDVTSFKPQPATTVRSRLGLDPEAQLICFGADWSTPRKGMDLLYEALGQVETKAKPVQVAVFGHTNSEKVPNVDFPVSYLGFVDEATLRELYSTADLMAVPSRQEAFGQTASEALASGTPVVAFDATGPRDIVDHKKTGYLAEPFDTADFANGIDWILADNDRQIRLGQQAREVAVDQFSVETVAKQYRDLYQGLT